MSKKKWMKVFMCAVLMMAVFSVVTVPVHASGNVAQAIENTWNAAQGQIQTVVNNVIFPVIDMLLAIMFL